MSGQQGGRFGFVGKAVNYVLNFFHTTEVVHEVCKFPGCNQPCYVESDGRVHDFCGRGHQRQYKAMKKDAERQNNPRPTAHSPQCTPGDPVGTQSSSEAAPFTAATAEPSTVSSLPDPTAALTVTGQKVCKLSGCNRPVYVDHNSGRVHDFCGRTHATQYKQQIIPVHLKCETPGCRKQKRSNRKGGYFNYCSKNCRDNKTLFSASTPNLQNASGFGTCSFPGCDRPKYEDPANGRVHAFCGRTHASQAIILGIQPSNPSIVRSANVEELKIVTLKFTTAWNSKKGACPKVDYIFVVSNSTLETRWSTYKQQLQEQTVEEHYHGTKLTCNLAQRPCNAPCNDKDCGICGISCTGLDRRCIRKNIDFQRFGHGFYLAPNSSKCHDYTQGAHGYRAMLLCDVCPGIKYSRQTNDKNLAGPPLGYDSVFGQVGQSLNYAEIVVYNPDAVVPRYIILYRRDGVEKRAT